jgi:excisionase family DNA binding protein
LSAVGDVRRLAAGRPGGAAAFAERGAGIARRGAAGQPLPSAMGQLAAAIAAALEDPEFAAAVAHLRPAAPPASATLDVRGAAEFLHLPVTTVRQYAREGRLPAFKAGRQWIFFRDDLERAVRGNLLAA